MMVQVFAFLAGIALGASVIPLARKIARMPITELLLAAFYSKQHHAQRPATVSLSIAPIVEESAKVKVASV